MVDIMAQTDQWTNKSTDTTQLSTFDNVTQNILPSFYKTLFDNDVQNKFKKDHKTISNAFMLSLIHI